METFNSLLPPGHQLAGTIDLDTNLAWSGSKISGELKAKVDEFHLNQNRLGNLQLQGRFTELGISIDESKLESKEGSVTAQGYLPWPDQLLSKMSKLNNSFHGLHLELAFKDAPVGMVNSYLPENIKVTSGSLNGTLNLDGAYGWPLFSGELEASHVKVETPLLPLPVEKGRISMNISHNKVFIERARGEYGEGRFSLNGEAILFGEEDQLHYNLNFKGSDLYYCNNYFDGFSNLNLLLTGTTNNSKLTGEINIFEGKIGLLKMAKKGTPDVKWNPSFDLKVTTGKNVRYRQVGIADISVRSNLRIGGDLKKPLISGEAVSNKGVLTLYGQTFKINKGKAIFKYSEGVYPYVDIESSVLTPKAEVFLTVKGQIGDDVSVNLYSYPSLSEEDLFALLNWSELRGDKPLSVQGIANTNLNIVTDTVFGEVFYELRQALHLDYLYLEHDYTADEFRISAGDYVSSKLFLSYSRSVADLPKEKWGLDYHLTSNLTAGGTYSLEDGTSWRLTYRFRF
ncbi:MAG: translocation/assembly module TamB domain-containing protein [Bacteroidota bacterium]